MCCFAQNYENTKKSTSNRANLIFPEMVTAAEKYYKRNMQLKKLAFKKL